MKIHHLNCGSLCPLMGAAAVTHCLLIETQRSGLMLIDSGIGDMVSRDPRRHMSAMNRLTLRPKLDPAESALSQISALGYKRGDVRHIALTHMDVDHAGGLLDFPDATVHVMEAELTTAQLRRDPRYDDRLWAHLRNPVTYAATSEPWLGLKCAGSLRGVDEDIRFIPLPGHTQGHGGVAVPRAGQNWLLHVGDALLVREELTSQRIAWGTRLGARFSSNDWQLRCRTLEQLRQLAGRTDRCVEVISSHCKQQWEDCTQQAISR